MHTRASRRAQRRRRQRGFTLIEVMMALTILTIGILGIISMQKSAVVTNNDAQQFTVATHIARTWVDRLTRDATTWNHPSVLSPASDLPQTQWLSAVEDPNLKYPQWFLPAGVAWPGGLAESPAFDRNGNDIAATSSAALVNDTVYCTNVRLRWLYQDQLMRAEVRVYWRKKNVSAGYATAVGSWTGSMCPVTGASTAVPAALSQDSTDFRWVYAVTSIARQGAK